MKRRELITFLAAAAAPFPVRAQKRPVVGLLASTSAGSYAHIVAAIRAGLSETGYDEGRNLSIEYRWAEDRYDRLPELAADLVRRKVDAIAAVGGIVSARAAKAATSTIPIVFAMSDDPVAAGLVASFARPAGNLTGVSFFAAELGPKLVELISELVPGATVVAVLANPNRASYGAVRQAVEGAARAKALDVQLLDVGADRDFEAAFERLKQSRAVALVVASDPLFFDRRDRLVALATAYAIPAVYAQREFAAAGGLISYGPSIAAIYRQLGNYVGQILAGHRASDLPVVQPTKFELVLSLKTAKQLGLTIPASILARADEVIE